MLKEPDIQVLPAPIEDEEEVEETPDKPKKKKAKKDNIFMKKPKSDPNAPPNDRIPLPELYVYKKFILKVNKSSKIARI